MKRRLNAFIEQLELALRLIAGGIRVGLGLRQALTMVIDELPDPSKHEFRRVIGQTNLGISVYDAIDDMAERMPGNETLMLARVFRVQSQTGGDLSHILDQLAGTIKDRRQIQRKVSTLTAEGRMSAWVLTAIPIGLGLFIIVTQQDMGSALLFTNIGHIVIGIVLVLELLGYLWVRQLLKVNA
jgi:tight adherence protein B